MDSVRESMKPEQEIPALVESAAVAPTGQPRKSLEEIEETIRQDAEAAVKRRMEEMKVEQERLESDAGSLYGGLGDARNSTTLENLANELETLRSHWEATNKNYGLSNTFDFEGDSVGLGPAGKRDETRGVG